MRRPKPGKRCVILFVVLSGDDESGEPTTEPTTAATTTARPTRATRRAAATRASPSPTSRRSWSQNGQPVGGVKELTFTKGEDIQFVVESDVADEVHLHGYDVGQDVEAGDPATYRPQIHAGLAWYHGWYHGARSKLFPPTPRCRKPASGAGFRLVGATGFEPATFRPPAGCATRLRHAPGGSESTTEGSRSETLRMLWTS
jgi:hypothetical protein